MEYSSKWNTHQNGTLILSKCNTHQKWNTHRSCCHRTSFNAFVVIMNVFHFSFFENPPPIFSVIVKNKTITINVMY